MSRIVINHNGGFWYTEGELADVVAKLVAGESVRCFWYEERGVRHEETVHFFGDPHWVRTDDGL